MKVKNWSVQIFLLHMSMIKIFHKSRTHTSPNAPAKKKINVTKIIKTWKVHYIEEEDKKLLKLKMTENLIQLCL